MGLAHSTVMSMRLQGKGLALIILLLVHSVFTSPLVKRDLDGLSETAIVESDSIAESELLGEDVFGGQPGEGTGAREKRLLKLKALGIGAGLKAAGAGVKAIGVSAAKTVGKKAVKAAVTVGATVAKAAITVGIAKLLLSLVFGKINQLIDFKTRLLGSKGGLLGSSNLSGGSSGGAAGAAGAQAEADVSFGDVAATTEAVQGYTYGPPLQQQPDYLVGGYVR